MHTRDLRRLLVLVWLTSCTSTSHPAPSVPPSASAPTSIVASADAAAAFVATDGQPARDRARVACERLLGGAPSIAPDTPRPPTVGERAWRLVHEPMETYRGGRRVLVLFAQVEGDIVEVEVDASTAAIETTPLASMDALASEPSCEAPAACGCFRECVEVVRLGPDGPEATYREIGPSGGRVFRRTPQCHEGRCARVCSAPGECVDALWPWDETCTGACLPDESPFHCARAASGCVRVEH